MRLDLIGRVALCLVALRRSSSLSGLERFVIMKAFGLKTTRIELLETLASQGRGDRDIAAKLFATQGSRAAST